MDKDNKQLDTLFKDMLANEGVAVGDRKVEIEHIAHAHQAIVMLKELKASDKLRFVIQRPDLTIGSDSKANSPFGVFPPGNGHINRPIGQNYTKSLTILKVR